MDYFLLSNFILTSTAISYHRYARANISAKLLLSGFAAICWVIPITLLRDFFPQDVALNTTWLTAQLPVERIASAIVMTPVTSNSPGYFSITISQVFIVLSIIGSLIFFNRGLRQSTWLRLVTDSMKNNYITTYKGLPVYTSTKIKNAVLIGYYKPKILINPRLVDSPCLDIILQHEATHFRHKDNYWLAIMQVIRAIYWWNPMLKYLLNNIEDLLEARCDYRTSQSFTEGIYLEKLTDLILDDLNTILPPVSNTGFVSAVISKNSNINRLKTLQENQIMNLFSKLTLSLLLVASIALVAVPFSSANSSNIDNSNSPIFNTLDEALSLSFSEIQLESVAKIVSDFYGIEYTVSEQLKKVPISVFAHNITPENSLKILTKITNASWIVENDHLYVRPLAGGVKKSHSLTSGKEVSIKLITQDHNLDNNLDDLHQLAGSTTWMYDLESERLVDFYFDEYLFKAKVNLISPDVVEILFEKYSLIDNEYRFHLALPMIAKIGEEGFIGEDGVRLFTIQTVRL